jgi:hypothetical protein
MGMLSRILLTHPSPSVIDNKRSAPFTDEGQRLVAV